MAAKKKKTTKKVNSLADRRKNAKDFFEKSDVVGPWILGLVEEGFDNANDGSCHIATENPEEARHAKALSLRQYTEAHRVNLIAFLSTTKGLRELERALTSSYNELQDDPEFDEEEEEDEDD